MLDTGGFDDLRGALLSIAGVESVQELAICRAPGAGCTSRRRCETDVVSPEAAVDAFEQSLLQRRHPEHPSTRRAAPRLQTSHSAIAQRLRTHGIG